jgi:hypothetical protein
VTEPQVSRELETEQQYRVGLEAALAAEVNLRNSLKDTFERQLAEEQAARQKADLMAESMRGQLTEERDQRKVRSGGARTRGTLPPHWMRAVAFCFPDARSMTTAMACGRVRRSSYAGPAPSWRCAGGAA